MERRGLPRGLPFAIRPRAFVTLVNSILLPLSRSLSVPRARPGSAIRQVFVFCGVVLNVYIRTDNMQHRKESLMPDDVATLGTQRSKLLEEFLSLGDLRPGSMTAVIRRCGKPSCHCAKHNVPGQEPQFRLTRRVAGKTVTESFADPTALRKAQQEVAEFHRFQKLSQDLVTLNEKICRLRPVTQERGGWTEQKRNGCCGPSGGGAGSKPTPRPSFCAVQPTRVWLYVAATSTAALRIIGKGAGRLDCHFCRAPRSNGVTGHVSRAYWWKASYCAPLAVQL
jgi:hypothetical protein